MTIKTLTEILEGEVIYDNVEVPSIKMISIKDYESLKKMDEKRGKGNKRGKNYNGLKQKKSDYKNPIRAIEQTLAGKWTKPKESFTEKALEYLLVGEYNGIDSILNNIQKSIALKRLNFAYKLYKNQTSIYDISPEEAAKRTYETLILEERGNTLYQLLGITIKHIKMIMNIPEDKWCVVEYESIQRKRPSLQKITSGINKSIEETKKFALVHRKRLLTNQYKKAKEEIKEEMESKYRSILLYQLFL